MNKVVDIVLIVMLIALLGPVALTAFLGVDTSTWPDPLPAVWAFIPIVAIFCFVVILVNRAKSKKRDEG